MPMKPMKTIEGDRMLCRNVGIRLHIDTALCSRRTELLATQLRKSKNTQSSKMLLFATVFSPSAGSPEPQMHLLMERKLTGRRLVVIDDECMDLLDIQSSIRLYDVAGKNSDICCTFPPEMLNENLLSREYWKKASAASSLVH